MPKAKFWKSQVRTYQKANVLPEENLLVYVYVTHLRFSFIYLQAVESKSEADTKNIARDWRVLHQESACSTGMRTWAPIRTESWTRLHALVLWRWRQKIPKACWPVSLAYSVSPRPVRDPISKIHNKINITRWQASLLRNSQGLTVSLHTRMRTRSYKYTCIHITSTTSMKKIWRKMYF